MTVFPAYMCTMCISSVYKGQKRVSGPLKTEWWISVCYHMDARNRTQDFFRNKCSKLRSHLSSSVPDRTLYIDQALDSKVCLSLVSPVLRLKACTWQQSLNFMWLLLGTVSLACQPCPSATFETWLSGISFLYKVTIPVGLEQIPQTQKKKSGSTAKILSSKTRNGPP